MKGIEYGTPVVRFCNLVFIGVGLIGIIVRTRITVYISIFIVYLSCCLGQISQLIRHSACSLDLNFFFLVAHLKFLDLLSS